MSVNDGQSSTWGNPLRNVSQGGGVSVSLSGGDEHREPESVHSSALHVDLHGRVEGVSANAREARAADTLPCQNSNNCIGNGIGLFQSAPLSPYRKKSRHRLEMAIEWMVKKHGIERVGLLTLSFGVLAVAEARWKLSCSGSKPRIWSLSRLAGIPSVPMW